MLKKNIKSIIAKWFIPSGYLQIIRKSKQRKAKKRNNEDKILLRESRNLLNRHANQRCFILGAGSSIKSQDLVRLKDEIVISVSNTFVHPDYHIIKPKYHAIPSLIESHGHVYKRDLWISWLKEMQSRTLNAEMFLHIGDRLLIENNNLFKDRKIYWNDYIDWDESPVTDIDLSRVPSVWSVSEYAITIALYMGFKEIFLLGFDHDWFNGPLVYFYDEKKEHVMQPSKERISFADAEFQMRRHAKIFKKYKYLNAMKKNIYNANANANTYVDVFPKIDFESIFND